MHKTINFFLLLSILVTVFLACKKTDPSQGGYIKIINASPNANPIDVLVRDQIIQSNLAYNDTSSYLPIASGTSNLKIASTGTSNYIINGSLTFQSGVYYSFFTIDSASKMKLAITTDDLTLPEANKAKMRFFHFSPNAGTLSIYDTASLNTYFSLRTFNDQSITKTYNTFNSIDIGPLTLAVRQTSRTDTGTIYTLPTINIESGKLYTLYANGFIGVTGTQAFGVKVITNN